MEPRQEFFFLVITNLSGSVISFFFSFFPIFFSFFTHFFSLIFPLLFFALIFLLFQCSTRNWCTLNLALIVSECGNPLKLLPGFNWRIYLNWNYLSVEKSASNWWNDQMPKTYLYEMQLSVWLGVGAIKMKSCKHSCVYCWLIWHKTQRTVSDNFPMLQFKCTNGCNVPEN